MSSTDFSLCDSRTETYVLIVKSQTKSLCHFGGLGGIQTLTRSLQDFYAAVTSPAQKHLVAVGGVEPPTSRL